MSLYRRAARRDTNEPPIIKALKIAGATVQQVSIKGVPDLLVGYDGTTFLLEVKHPLGPKGGKSSHGQALSEDEAEWHRKWRGGVCAIVRYPGDALRVIGAI